MIYQLQLIFYALGQTNTLFKRSENFNINILCDASHGIHMDGKGQSGSLVLINDNPVFFRSRKLKINTLSSTESELVAISDSLSPIINIINIIEEIGIRLENKTLHQDNLSTIQMIKNGKPKTMKTKHINIRYFTAKNMLADMLTKPLQGQLFDEFRNTLFNINK